MKTQSSMLHVRMDTEMKRKATAALAAMGMTASEAVRLLFHRIAADQAFPLELKVPNAQTRNAMAEVDEMVKTRTARFASVDEMFVALEEACGVQTGEQFVITKHGRPIAELVPFRKTDPDKVQAAIDDLRAFQKTHCLGGLSVRDMIEEGRRR